MMTQNPIELLLTLGVNDTTSKRNINEYLRKLKTEDLGITITIDGAGTNTKILEDMRRQLEKLQEEAKKAKEESKKLIQELNKIKSSGNSGGNGASKVITDLKHEQEQIRNFLKNKGFQSFDFKMNIDTRSGQKVLKGFTANVRDLNGEIKKLDFDSTFKQLSTSLKDNNLKSYKTSLEAVEKSLLSAKNKALLSSKEIEKFQNKAKSIKMDDTNVDKSGAYKKLKQEIEQTIASTKRFESVSDKINNSLISMGRNGSLSAEKLGEISQKVAKINSKDITLDEKVVKLQRVLKQLNSEFDKTVHAKKMSTAMEDAKRKVKDLESAFIKMVNQNKRTTSTMDLSSYKRQLEELSRIKPFKSQKDIDDFNRKLKQSQSEVKRLGSDLTQAGRESQTLLQNFKTAMTKFPIWMAASTLFFGVTRTLREFGSIIVDIDSKIVGLTKVMNENTDFGKVFENAQRSAESFGQSISNVMDSYVEFAKQGFKEDELTYLADAALVASNVADLDAQKSSEFLTSTLIQWKMEATDAMGVIDSFNEISNNFATTTEKLADGQAKSAATARAMGLDFNELNGIIGTV